MKKFTVIFSLLFLLGITAQAQDLTSKKGFQILPKAGDFALGFDAVPFIDFALNAVNIMNNTGQTAQHMGYVSGFNNVLVGKYFIKDNLAVRGKLAINTNSFTTKLYYDNPDDMFKIPGDPTKWNEIYDATTVYTNDIILGAGLEFRRGHNRLQGFYGGEALVGTSSGKTTRDYGVEMTKEAITNAYTNGNGSALDGRTLSTKAGSSISFGLRGFVGVEYFIAPKISLAGEFGWGFGIMNGPRGSSETENWDAANSKVEIEKTDGPTKGSAFQFAVDDGIGQNLSGSAALNLIFHF